MEAIMSDPLKAVSFRFHPDVIKMLQEIAKNENRSLTNVLETLVKNKYEKGENKMGKLFKMYVEWRKVSQEMLDDGMDGSFCSGKQCVREDFSNYAELAEKITYAEMSKLERKFENM
jgi:predicted transcriptional regulator